MSVEKISELLSLMKEYEIVELELEEGDFSIALRKQGAFAPSYPINAQAQMAFAPAPQAAPLAPAPAQPAAAPGAASDASGLLQINSPIVGTFYRAPSPDSQPFVEVGAKVTKDKVVCIIEAMKIMNEIRAEVEGVIEKVLVESGEPVEYGQPLFLVKRAGA